MESAPPHRLRRWLIPLVSLVAMPLAFVGYAVWLGEQIPKATVVEGIDLGGLDPLAAQQRLEQSLSVPTEPVQISVGSQATSIRPAQAGISIDYARTVADLPRRSLNPIWLLEHLINGRSHRAVVQVERGELARALSELSGRATNAPIEGDIVFAGLTPTVIEPVAGTGLDLPTLVAQIKREWLDGRRQFGVGVIAKAPTVTRAEVDRVLAEFAQPAVSGPVILTIDGNPITVNPRVIAAALHFHPDDQGRLIPHLSKAEFTAGLGARWPEWTVPARDASFKTIDGVVTVVPSIKGRDVSAERLEEAMLAALTRTGLDRVASVVTVEVDPPLTTEAALDLDLRERIGYFQTQFPWTSYRAHNIHRAADILNGTIVAAGEVFSLNGTIGKRTAANGFVEGVVISGGRLAKEFGGGVSQIATTTWNAAWFAGLELLQHKPHSFYISRYPVGRESTVSWPNVDVKFRNDTGKPILITSSYYSNRISISIYGNRKYEVETITGPRTNPTTFKSYEDDSPTCINQDGVTGFTIEVTRILKSEGVEVSRKVYRTRYLPEDRVRCTNPEATFGNAPTTTPKPKPKPKPTVAPSPSETTPTPTPVP